MKQVQVFLTLISGMGRQFIVGIHVLFHQVSDERLHREFYRCQFADALEYFHLAPVNFVRIISE